MILFTVVQVMLLSAKGMGLITAALFLIGFTNGGYERDTTKYAPDGTAYTVSSGTTGNAAAGTTGATGTAGTTSNGSTNILTPYLPGNTPDFLAKLGVTEGDNGGFPQDNGGQPSGGGGHASTSIGGYTAAQLTPATSQADYINAMYDANEQRQRAALETAYDANVATLNQQEAKIAPQYQQAANAAAAQSAVAQAAFNERAAAAGMNTGAGSQAALAQNNALQSNISSIRQAESEALAEVEAQRASLSQQYQKAIAEAVANNEAERAQALYAEAVRVDESLVSTAANQAAENFNAWQAAYKLAKG